MDRLLFLFNWNALPKVLCTTCFRYTVFFNYALESSRVTIWNRLKEGSGAPLLPPPSTLCLANANTNVFSGMNSTTVNVSCCPYLQLAKTGNPGLWLVEGETSARFSLVRLPLLSSVEWLYEKLCVAWSYIPSVKIRNRDYRAVCWRGIKTGFINFHRASTLLYL